MTEEMTRAEELSEGIWNAIEGIEEMDRALTTIAEQLDALAKSLTKIVDDNKGQPAS